MSDRRIVIIVHRIVKLLFLKTLISSLSENAVYALSSIRQAKQLLYTLQISVTNYFMQALLNAFLKKRNFVYRVYPKLGGMFIQGTVGLRQRD